MKSLFGVFIMRRGGEDIWWRVSERIKSAKKERWRFGRWRFVFSCTVSQFELLHAMPNIIFLCFKILCIFLRVLKSGCMKGIPCQQRTVAWLYLLNTWRYFLEIREKIWDILEKGKIMNLLVCIIRLVLGTMKMYKSYYVLFEIILYARNVV